MDDSLLTDPAVIAWKQMNILIENGASDTDVDQAYRKYLEAVEEMMRLKTAKVGACRSGFSPENGSVFTRRGYKKGEIRSKSSILSLS